MQRREFTRIVAAAAAGTAVQVALGPRLLAQVQDTMQSAAPLTPQACASNEDMWRDIQAAFSTNRALINLDNGNVCPSPRIVTESMVRHIWLEEEAPGYAIYDVELPRTINVANALAQQLGCSLDEIALVRNTTEALDIILLGIELKPGDEILTTTHDYWAMQEALDQRAARDGIAVKRVPVPTPASSMDQLVDIFERGITARTRLILVSHPVNLTGQFFPVKRICQMAHARGIEVCVDGAQGFAHMDFTIRDLDCDYFGTSLHKWLLAPIGTGLLYIKQDKIGKVWPLLPAPTSMSNTMFKFMRHGTLSAAPFLAISDAIAFHNAIGAKRKEERLRYLTGYWVKQVQKMPKTQFLTSFSSPEMSCGLATCCIEGVDSKALERYLQQRHSILVQSMSSHWAPEVQGIRVSPNLYTTLRDLDRFCEVINEVSTKGIPSGSPS
jgi:isopenicillin-N epimerase